MVVNETLNLSSQPLTFLNGVLVGLLNRVVIVLVILFTGFIIGKVVGKFVAVILSELEFVKPVARLFDLRFSVEDVIGRILSYIIL
jgi:hypothetical protein